MLSTISSTVGDMLISNGVKVLGNSIKNTTEDGLEKIDELVKEETGIEIFNENTELSDDQCLELKKLESSHTNELCTYMVEYAKVALENTEKARVMQDKVVTRHTNEWFPKNFIYIFALLWSAFAIVYILLITITNIPAENQRFADTILGFVLGTVIASMLQFFYGSSLKMPDYTSTTTKHKEE